MEALVERPRMRLPFFTHIYTGVDPSGGGQSAYAVCSIARTLNGAVVVRSPLPLATPRANAQTRTQLPLEMRKRLPKPHFVEREGGGHQLGGTLAHVVNILRHERRKDAVREIRQHRVAAKLAADVLLVVEGKQQQGSAAGDRMRIHGLVLELPEPRVHGLEHNAVGDGIDIVDVSAHSLKEAGQDGLGATGSENGWTEQELSQRGWGALVDHPALLHNFVCCLPVLRLLLHVCSQILGVEALHTRGTFPFDHHSGACPALRPLPYLSSLSHVLIVSLLLYAEAASQHRLLIGHLEKLRSLPACRNATVVLGLESNLGFEAQHTVHSLKRAQLHNWVTLMEGADGSCGMLTTNSSKEVMCVALQELLSANLLHVSAQLLCTSIPPVEAMNQLLQEMRSFMIYVDPPKTLFAKPRRTYTGKVGGHQDDMVITLQLAVLTMQIFTRSEKYARFHS